MLCIVYSICLASQTDACQYPLLKFKQHGLLREIGNNLMSHHWLHTSDSPQ